MPRPCDFVVTKGVNSVLDDIRRQTRSSVAHGDFDIGGPDFASYREATSRRRRLGHRVHGVHHQVHEHLLQEHLIAADDARIRRQIDVRLDLPRSHVVGDEGKALVYDGVKIDRFLLQLTTSEHGPMALDDLRGEDAFGMDIGQDLSDCVRRRTIGGDHHLQRLGVVHHRTEGLTELMCDRAGQRRHRRAATGVSGECQVPPAVDLGPLPCAALEQEPDDQERLDGQCAGGGQNRDPVFAPQARTSIAHHAAGRQATFGDAPPLQLAPVECRLAWRLRRYSDAARRLAVQNSNGRVGRVATRGRQWTSAYRRQRQSRGTRCAPQTAEHSPWREVRRALARPHTPLRPRRCRR